MNPSPRPDERSVNQCCVLLFFCSGVDPVLLFSCSGVDPVLLFSCSGVDSPLLTQSSNEERKWREINKQKNSLKFTLLSV